MLAGAPIGPEQYTILTVPCLLELLCYGLRWVSATVSLQLLSKGYKRHVRVWVQGNHLCRRQAELAVLAVYEGHAASAQAAWF